MRRGPVGFGGYGGEASGNASEDEDLAMENERLKQELHRARARQRSSSFVGSEPASQGNRSSSLNVLQGRAQEHLREVIEENEILMERLQAKEHEVEEWRADYAKLRQLLEQEKVNRIDCAAEEKESPKDIRLFKKRAHDIMKKIQDEKEQDLAKADQAKKILKMQVEDGQARNAKAKAEIVRLERELARSEALNQKREAAMEDLQTHYDELRGMLEGERRAEEELKAKVQRLEEELEAERMHQSQGAVGDTLDQLDLMHRRTSIGSSVGELVGLCDEAGGRMEPEIAGQLKEHLAELQNECEQLRAQLALAQRSQAVEHARHEEQTPCSSCSATARRAEGLEEEREDLKRQLGSLEELQQENEELRRQLGDAEGLQQECAELRRRLGGSEARAGLHKGLQQECDELRRRLADMEGLQQECEELRKRLGSAEAQLVDAERQREDAERQLAEVAREKAERPEHPQAADGPHPVSERGEETEELRRECERLQAQLAAAQEDLSRAKSAAEEAAARAPALEPKELEDLRRQCDQLREQLAVARQAEQPVREEHAACSSCAWLQRQLQSAQELQQELRAEHGALRRQLGDALALEEERRCQAEALQLQLESACSGGRSVEEAPSHSAPPQLAGARPPTTPPPAEPPAAAPEPPEPEAKADPTADEREELQRRNQELLESVRRLMEQVQAKSAEEPSIRDAVSTMQAEELRALRKECHELRDKLHAARMAEIQAQRKADAVPELMSSVATLRLQVEAAEKLAAEWREAASDTTWGGIFSSFMCAAPPSRSCPSRGA